MKKMLRCLAVATAALGIAASVGGQALAAYPDKQVRLVVPYPPGTGTDKVARYTAMRLEKALGQGVVVENRAGGSRSEEHTSELQSRENLVCRLLLEK